MENRLAEYWKKNITIVFSLLAVWALVSYFCGIFFVKPLNAIHLGGYPLGFWFAQQGSEIIFVILIFVYYKLMSNLDKKYDVHE